MSVTREDKVQRRREVRDIASYLKDGLFERNRDYAERNEAFNAGKPGAFTCEIKDIEVDREHEMLWGSPLGWRVLIRLEESMGKERIALKVFKPNGDLYAGPFVYDEYGYSVGVNWLDAGNLP